MVVLTAVDKRILLCLASTAVTVPIFNRSRTEYHGPQIIDGDEKSTSFTVSISIWNLFGDRKFSTNVWSKYSA